MSFNIHKEVATWLMKTQDAVGESVGGRVGPAYSHLQIKEALAQMAASGAFPKGELRKGSKEILRIVKMTKRGKR
jgi:hypothetical protein